VTDPSVTIEYLVGQLAEMSRKLRQLEQVTIVLAMARHEEIRKAELQKTETTNRSVLH
jgi:hypothetical protein